MLIVKHELKQHISVVTTGMFVVAVARNGSGVVLGTAAS